MEIVRINNLAFGEKCYIKHDGAIRECIFNGTMTTEKGVAMNLNVAGIGTRNMMFPRFNTFDKWYHGKAAPCGLYKTIEDCKANRQLTAMYGSTDNCYNSSFMQPFFKNVSVCNCGGSCYAWWWNGIEPIRVFVALPKGYFEDEDGFRFDGNFRIIGTPDNLLRIFHREVSEDELYMTKSACESEHEAKVITF